MNKAAFIGPVVFLALGFYLLAISMGAGEEVSILPGHQMPSRFGLLLGGLGIVGGIVVGVEVIRKMRETNAKSAARHVEQR